MRPIHPVSSQSALLLAVGSALALSSCGKVKDMHDATMEMRENMNKTVKTTEGMAGTTCKMYTSLRQGNSKVSRDTDMEAIEKGGNIVKKLEISAKYMQGFEYQVWAPDCSDLAPREIVIEQAATELLTAIQPYAKNRAKVDATKQSDKYETLYALAGTLHRTNSLQEEFLAGTNEKAMRPLDIIVQGLRLNQAKNRGVLSVAEFPSWANVVGKYAKDAEFLLRLRGNFLMAYAYAIADANSFGDSPGIAKKLWHVKVAKKWVPNLGSRDATEIRERITVALRLSVETRSAMIDLGMDPMVDDEMIKVWKNADFSSYNLEAMKAEGGDKAARAKAIKELIEARDRMLVGGAGGTW